MGKIWYSPQTFTRGIPTLTSSFSCFAGNCQVKLSPNEVLHHLHRPEFP